MNLQSRLVKIFLAALLILAGIMAYVAATGRLMIFGQKVLGAAALPFQKLSSAISGAVDSFNDGTINIKNVVSENEQLKEELARLRKKQVDYDRLALENREYKKLIDSYENIRDYRLVSASVIGRDGADMFYSFTIDRGSDRGISVNDVVISSEGVVGVVTETSRTFSRVSTILSPNVNAGCFVGSARETGIACGSFDLSKDGMCMVRYLPKESRAAREDIVSTSGYGTVFPRGLIIGTVDSVRLDSSGDYSSAYVKPAADVANVKFVFVITNRG